MSDARRLPLTMVVLAVAGCGAPPISEDAFAGRIAAALCAKTATCCAGRPASNCETRVAAAVRNAVSSTAGLRYDAARAGACVAHIEGEASCSALASDLPPGVDCAGVYDGTLPLGAPCSPQPAATERCRLVDGYADGAELVGCGLGAPTLCKAIFVRGGVGSPCGEAGPTTTACRPDVAMCIDGTCVGYAAVGEPCSAKLPCGPHASCSSGRCVARPTEGQACSAGTCDAELFCSGTPLECTARPGLGEACSTGECSDSFACLGGRCKLPWLRLCLGHACFSVNDVCQ